MIIKCTNCGGRVKFNIEKQLFVCDNCDRLIENVQIEKNDYRFDRYHCSSCGSELNVNEGETTSVCPYCGAQSIIYDGSCGDYNVDYIIPFKVSYNNAVNIINSEFEHYKFTPKKFKKFTIENVRPLYVPYALFDIHMDTTQVIEVVEYKNKKSYYHEHTKAIEIDYDEVEIVMSSKLPNQLITELAPWDFSEKKEFNPAYIAGLSALVSDVNDTIIQNNIIGRAQEFIDEKVMASCPSSNGKKRLKAKYDYEITDKKTILLPIWFFSSSYKGQKYSVIVNGQTGHIISAVPYSKPAFWGITMTITALLVFISILLIIISASSNKDKSLLVSILVPVAIGTLLDYKLFDIDRAIYFEYKQKIKLLNDNDVIDLAKEK